MTTREKVMAALLSSDTQAEAAAKCGITDRAIRKYLSDPGFSADYARARRQLVGETARQIQIRLRDAIQTLHAIMKAEAAIPCAREKMAAARVFLEYGLRYTEMADLEGRVAALEEALMEDKKS